MQIYLSIWSLILTKEKLNKTITDEFNKFIKVSIIIDDEKYINLLKGKLIEEGQEVFNANNFDELIEELSDILFVRDYKIKIII